MLARLRRGVVTAAGSAGTVVRSVPGVLGAVLVCVGLGLAWLPLGVIAAGGFLLAIDARIPAESPRPRMRWPDGRPRTAADVIALRRRAQGGV